jgi:hypothetical protein
MENMRVLIDRLEQATRARRSASGTSTTSATPAPAIPGLKYQPGDRVVDLTGGQKGTIAAGARDETTARQVYAVELRDGRTVFRTLSELERDVLPAPRPS